MITVLDYGSGNVRAFLNAYQRMKIPCRTARKVSDLDGAARIILPGVGAFDTALAQFEASGMMQEVRKRVLEQGVPLLGVCVGMQMLADSSEEGTRLGLGWIPGSVRKLRAPVDGGLLRLPHMGWNTISIKRNEPLLLDLPNGGKFYFLHSFAYVCADPLDEVASSHYCGEFTCAIRRRNVWATQFHPEKSHDDGMALLKNFATIT